MPVSAMAPRPLRRLSLLVLGVEDAFGLATIRQLEADGHQVIAAHVEGRRSGTDLGLPARGPSGGDGAGLSPGTQPCNAVVFLAPLAADACSAAAYHLTASRRARHANALATLAEILYAERVPRPVLRSSTSLYADHKRNSVTDAPGASVGFADVPKSLVNPRRSRRRAWPRRQKALLPERRVVLEVHSGLRCADADR